MPHNLNKKSDSTNINLKAKSLFLFKSRKTEHFPSSFLAKVKIPGWLIQFWFDTP